jgi:hypothetical protein
MSEVSDQTGCRGDDPPSRLARDNVDDLRLREGLGLAYALHAGLATERLYGGRSAARELSALAIELIGLLENLVRSRAGIGQDQSRPG